eukprot:10786309-Heterocapsa_arctica.AAC.1
MQVRATSAQGLDQPLGCRADSPRLLHWLSTAINQAKNTAVEVTTVLHASHAEHVHDRLLLPSVGPTWPLERELELHSCLA